MKKICFLVFSILSATVTLSQNKQDQQNSVTGHKNLERCGTMEVIKKMIAADLALPLKWKKKGEKIYNTYLQTRRNNNQRPTAIDTIIIPVVFHLIGNAAILSNFSDRDAYEQIEILNRDYHGGKADLYKGLYAEEFESRIGRLNLKFVLARRTPSGQLTNGIERRVIDSVFSRDNYKEAKHFATGGLNAWDSEKYLNVWGVNFTDNLLGIATFPFSADADEQGVEVNLYTIGANTCRLYYPQYNEGASLSHEVGHYFYLWHTWGDDNGTCGDKDFRTQEGYTLPAEALADDTPDQGGSDAINFGNLSGVYTDNCSPVYPGIMYMNFMNYYDDRSLFMFTKGQQQRMSAAINIYRPGLKTSDGYLPPVNINDAYLVKITPFGRCDTRAPVISNTPVIAFVRNSGTSLLTSVTLNLSADEGTAVSTSFPLNLAPGNDTSLTLPLLNLTQGNHTIHIYMSAPNGLTDNFLSNDTLTSYINARLNTVSPPLTETFSSATFPPAGWIINNPQDSTWRLINTAGYSAAGAATVQNFYYERRGQIDELITPPLNFSAFDSSVLTFYVANAQYGSNTNEFDGLEIYVSSDGGQTYTLAYKKVSHELKTIPDFFTDAFNPLSDKFKWRKESVNLTNFINKDKPLIIKFRNVNAYGNNTYIDDINISGISFVSRDAFVRSITGVPALLCNTNSLKPSLLFGSNGIDTLRALTINYELDNGILDSVMWTGKLTQGETALIYLDSIPNVSAGTHIISVFTSNPNGLPDLYAANDTIRKTIVIVPQVNSPLKQGFEDPVFPPAGWFVQNSDDDITWERTTGAARSGAASMVIRNFDYATSNTSDKFISSLVSASNFNFDSLFVSFDYAYQPGKTTGTAVAPRDTLELQISLDCGTTFTTLFKKWGQDLQTINNFNSAGERFIPVSTEWKSARAFLTPIVSDRSFQLYFTAKSNNQNNLYIDNINVSGKILPQRLKKQGYLIYPSPFISSFIIRNLQVPTKLKAISVYNSMGQLVYNNYLNGTGNTEITVNLSTNAAGVYIVKLDYEDKTVVEKIVKSSVY